MVSGVEAARSATVTLVCSLFLRPGYTAEEPVDLVRAFFERRGVLL
jgi:hypothetical protein